MDMRWPRTITVALSAVGLAAVAAPPAAMGKLTLRSRISTEGVGPLKIEMTVKLARRATGRRIAYRYLQLDCGVARLFPRRFGVTMLTTSPHASHSATVARVVRISVGRPGIRTRSGAQVGDSVQRLKKLYGSQLVRVRQHYEPSLFSYEIREGNRKVVFTTDNHTVTAIDTGRKPEIDLVEGCA